MGAMESTDSPGISEPPQPNSTPEPGSAPAVDGAPLATAPAAPAAPAAPPTPTPAPALDLSDPAVQQQVREFMRAENQAAEKERQAAERAAARPQSVLSAQAHTYLNLDEPFTDPPGVALVDQTTRVLGRIAGWESANDDPRQPEQLRLGREQLMDLTRQAQMHRYYLNQQTPAGQPETAVQVTPEAVRASTMAQLAEESTAAVLAEKYPGVSAAILDGRLTHERLVGGIDWSRGEDVAFDQLAQWLPTFEAMLSKAPAVNGNDPPPPAPAITPPPSTPSTAPGESAGYSAASPGGAPLSETDYNALVAEEVRRRTNRPN